jgi:uncharacterized protein (TIGR00369 family)
MDIRTHKRINLGLCGTPVALKDGFSQVQLEAGQEMAVDESGLVHGGFVFGLADYAAMIAVNDPNVVLGAANVRFLKPVRIGEAIVAEARVTSTEGRKHGVSVTIRRAGVEVFTGEFTCFVLEKHVLG